MKITKAVITAAGREQRDLPLQTLVDRDGARKSVLRIIVDEVLRAGVEEICVVVHPEDEAPYAKAVGERARALRFEHQQEPLGYGHAVHCARDFVGGDPFLHLVGDQLDVSRTDKGCAQQVVDVAEVEECSVSAVQRTRESLLPYYGVIGGEHVPGKEGLYAVKTALEKPSPTTAEQHLTVPGLRAGEYLCFFGMHVLTPTIFDLLGAKIEAAGDRGGVDLSPSLADLAERERYLALEVPGWRYDLGAKYGVLTAQLALALSGRDREEVLSTLLEVLAQRELGAAKT